VYLSHAGAEVGIAEIRRDHPDLQRSDFVIQAQRIRSECDAASASAPAVPRETRQKENADMSPGNPASGDAQGQSPVAATCGHDSTDASIFDGSCLRCQLPKDQR
jgi:hypothetical protein